MKILVIGSGGREHALVWKIAQSPLVKKIYCAPGNAGIGEIAELVDIPATDILALRNFAYKNKIDLTVVGPEAPLVAGIVDSFREEGLKIFGPTRLAAELEGSKAFCKELLRQNLIPTAGYRLFRDAPAALNYLQTASYPQVIKADGLAAGKGVIIVDNFDSAQKAIKQVMEEKAFGTAGNSVLVEEFLTGREVSIMVITDGSAIVMLDPAQDHKRAFDNNTGPNTGGMGAYSPVPFITPALLSQVIQEIIVPTVHALNRAHRPYQGVLYAGLMLTTTGPKVLEYNVRFGDPETQPLMMRLKNDLVPVLQAASEKRLHKIDPLEWHPKSAICVVIASGGYPDKYEKGMPIAGLPEVRNQNDIQVFHAGTALKDDTIVTAGGRVLGVTGLGKDISEAREKTYAVVRQISFGSNHPGRDQDSFYRTDIGKHAL